MNTITKPTDKQLHQFGRILESCASASPLRDAWAFVEETTCKEIESMLTPALLDAMVERRRQGEKGFNHKHDDKLVSGELTAAAVAYAMDADQGRRDGLVPKTIPDTRRKMLIKAAALLLAEVERIDRAEAAKKG